MELSNYIYTIYKLKNIKAQFKIYTELEVRTIRNIFKGNDATFMICE